MSAPESAPIRVDLDYPICVVTLDRPDRRNSADAQMHGRLASIWTELAADRRIKAIVLTGSGKTFSAGGDLDWFAEIARNQELREQVMTDARRIVVSMTAVPVPVVCAVNGPAVGLGCSLAALSDIVIMADDAFLADPHVGLGLVAADGGAVMWPFLTGLNRAKEYLFTGDRIPAESALSMGLVNRVVAPEKVLDEAVALARRLASQPSKAIIDTKRAVNMHMEHALGSILSFALASESECFTTDAHRSQVRDIQEAAAKRAARARDNT